MRSVIQRVRRAKVTVSGEVTGEIGPGILLLLGVSKTDTAETVRSMVDRVVNLRIFDDAEGKMNLSLLDVSGELLVVSQFTLYGDARRGRRPSYIDAAAPEQANGLYEAFVEEARKSVARVETGRFQAMMDVELVNDGPVTLLIDSDKAF